MAALTFSQLEQTWITNGGTPGWAPLMAGIALAESGGTPGAIQPTQPPQTTGWGLWQITPGTRKLLTPTQNAKAAVAKFDTQGLTAWKTDRTWDAWQAAGAPSQPGSTAVMSYVQSWGGSTLGSTQTVASTSSAPTTATVQNAEKAGYPTPGPGQSFLAPGQKTYSIVTGSVIPGVSATPPTTPSFGDNPIGDLATSLRFTGAFGGWALMTGIVFLMGGTLMLLGGVMLGAVLFGPTVGAAGRLIPGPIGTVTSIASSGARTRRTTNRARSIEAQTRLKTARAKRSTRNEADALEAHSRQQAARQRTYNRRKRSSQEAGYEPF